jgi:hypothetical protein
MEPTVTLMSDEQVADEPSVDPVELLDGLTPTHPALKRLADRRDATQPVEAAITSYDRMHHRHSRS